MTPKHGRPPAEGPAQAAADENKNARSNGTTSQDGWAGLGLLPQHVEVLRVRGISPDVARERGYASLTAIRQAKRLGFSEAQCLMPALLIPLHNVAGELAAYQLRPDTPRVRDGKPVKYEAPRSSQPVLDCPPRARPWVLDPEQPLLITEGTLKADAAAARDLACLAIAGVWNWRSPAVIAALDQLPLKGRTIYLTFDSDWRRNRQVEQALRRLAAVLRQRGAVVYAIDLPEPVPGQKVGLDDYLAAGHGALDLLHLPAIELTGEASEDWDQAAAGAGDYRVIDGGLARITRSLSDDGRDRVSITRLTNFTAQIVVDVSRDDGSGEAQRAFEIAATLGERLHRFTIPASQFASMSWVTEHLGAGAIVYPGQSVREHARVAIQVLSGEVPERRVFTHTGWREIDGERLYLHGAGAVGRDGQVVDIHIDLPAELRRLALPAPPAGEERIAAINASLALLEVAPDPITVPLFAAIYRAALGATDFGLHLAGPTGVGKTELAALAQQHYGPACDARHLPASWLSTGNALETLAFAAKDVLLVVDDFAPGGSAHDVARLHREADRLLRAQGNAAGRTRLRPDASLRPAHPPRGLILSTGEDVPRGQSLRARLLVLEVGREDVRWDRLTACQQDAAAGRFAASLTAFIQWVAGLGDSLPDRLAAETAALRELAQRPGQHRRTPAIVASLGAGCRLCLAFAVEVGALDDAHAAALWRRMWAALGAAAEVQGVHQAASDPARRFIELIAALLASGRGHLAAPDGGAPVDAAAWGWRDDGERWRPLGERLGWVDGEDVYLEPEASYAAAQRLARDSGEGLPVSAATLRRRLAERGLLASREEARETLLVRRVLEGRRRAVLHLAATALYAPESDQPDQPDHEPADRPESCGFSRADGQVSWSGFGGGGGKPDHETRPQTPATTREMTGDGQVGQVSSPRYEAPPNGRAPACVECGELLSPGWPALSCARHGGTPARIRI